MRFTPGFHPGMSRPLYRGNGSTPERFRRLGGDQGHNRDRDHDGDRDHHHHGRDYWSAYWYGYGYPYYYGPVFTGYVDPWLFAPDDYGYDNSGYAANDGYGGYGYGDDVPAPYRNYGQQPNQPEDNDEQSTAPQAPSGRPAYNGDEGGSGTTAAAARENTITIIFKDGRPPEHVQNYLLTSSTLTVLDTHYHQIPLADVDIAATQEASRAAGVDFHVPPALQ